MKYVPWAVLLAVGGCAAGRAPQTGEYEVVAPGRTPQNASVGAQEAAPPAAAADRHSFTLFVAPFTDGDVSLRRTGSVSSFDEQDVEESIFAEGCLSLDIGGLGEQTRGLLTLEFGGTGFESASDTAGDHVRGHWQWFEAVFGAEQVLQGGGRIGGGFVLGYHGADLEFGGMEKSDSSSSLMNFGFQLSMELPIAARFRIGVATEATVLTAGQSTWGEDASGGGHTLSLAARIAWKPGAGFAMVLGYGIWEGDVDWKTRRFLSTDTEEGEVSFRAHGPLVGVEWSF